MQIIQILFIAAILAIDEVGVVAAIGVRDSRHTLKRAIKISLLFTLFQISMPVFGWLLGSVLRGLIEGASSYIAAGLLVLIGGTMVFEGLKKQEREVPEKTSLKKLLLLAFATNIDAMVVGASIRLIDFSILTSSIIFGAVTFLLCFIAYYLGTRITKAFNANFEIIGGVFLILIGITFLFW